MSTATVTPPPQPQPQAPATMTAEEFGRKYAGRHVEFIHGQVKEIPMAGGKHGKVCNWVAFHLTQYAVANDSGHVFINDTFVKVPTKDDPERVYGADVCYVPYSRLAKDAEVPDGVLPVIPELVVEVRSPSDSWSNVVAKMLDYVKAGVAVVVILDPKTRSASVFRDQDRQDIFEADQDLVLPDILPGFSAPVGRFFE